MTNAIALHIGINAVDPSHYGSALPLSGCHADARDMSSIARAAGFRAKTLLDGEATSNALSAELDAAARLLVAGDIFLLTYAGHGTRVPDVEGDESDRLDEAWVLFDRMFLDDEVHAAFAGFAPGVRVCLISDSCHSGTMARRLEQLRIDQLARTRGVADAPLRYRSPTEPDFGRRVLEQNPSTYGRLDRTALRAARAEVRAAVIAIGGCQDHELAGDGEFNGMFTGHLKEVWDSGAYQGDHPTFLRAIEARMPTTQRPNYTTAGQSTAAFEHQRPFTVRAPVTPQQYDGADDMSRDTQGDANWSEVRTELERMGWRGAPAIDANSGYVGAMPNSTDSSIVSSRAATGVPIVRAFWWGFHIECSSQGLNDFLNAAKPINEIAAAIGPVTGPAAPFVLAAAAFIAAALGLLRSIDRGKGVYISMSWFAPGVFIPTTVPGGRSASLSRSSGEPYEQAGEPWRRSYGGGLFGLRLEEDIYWNLPDGTVRESVIVHKNPPNFGNIYFNHWLSDDPTVGHFRLHVGVASLQGGAVELRMMIRDAEGRRSVVTKSVGPRALTADEL